MIEFFNCLCYATNMRLGLRLWSYVREEASHGRYVQRAPIDPFNWEGKPLATQGVPLGGMGFNNAMSYPLSMKESMILKSSKYSETCQSTRSTPDDKLELDEALHREIPVMLDPLRSCWSKMMILHVTLSLLCSATVTMKLLKQPMDYKPGRFWKIYPFTLTLF